MPIDPDNQVVKLCAAGMEAEAQNRFADARTLFEQAWAARRTNLDACIAAHYLARLQDEPERILHWNQEALRYADTVAAEETNSEIGTFYPSLYLNLGKSYEDMGDTVTANHYYHLATHRLQLLIGEYGELVRRGIAAGLRRTTPGA